MLFEKIKAEIFAKTNADSEVLSEKTGINGEENMQIVLIK